MGSEGMADIAACLWLWVVNDNCHIGVVGTLLGRGVQAAKIIDLIIFIERRQPGCGSSTRSRRRAEDENFEKHE